MINCEFSVIKYVPNTVRFEPVNIGIALMDKDKKQIHNKFINDFNELFLRLGVDKIHGLEQSFKKYNSIVDVESDDYLWKIRKGFHGSIFYSQPTKITSDSVDFTLEQIFTKMISIKENEQIVKESVLIKNIKEKIRKYFSPLKLSKETYCERYKISRSGDIPQTRQFAFLKDRKLINTIDILNLSDGQVFNPLKLFLYEIHAIIESKLHPDNKPYIFSTNDVNPKYASDRIKQSIELLNTKKIDIVYPKSQQEKLEEIKVRISE